MAQPRLLQPRAQQPGCVLNRRCRVIDLQGFACCRSSWCRKDTLVQGCDTISSGLTVQTAVRAKRHTWLAANAFSPRLQVTQAGFKTVAEDSPFIKVSLQPLWEHQAVHNRSHHSGLVSLTSLIFEGFSLLHVLMLPCFQRAWKAETQIHNMQQISQALAGGLSPRVRRGLCITPLPAETGPAPHWVPSPRVLWQPRVLGPGELLPRLMELWGQGGNGER